MDTPTPIDLPGIRNITVSGRIASGTTTLAKKVAESLGWKLFEGGALFAKIHESLSTSESNVSSRDDSFDLDYEKKLAAMLRDEEHLVIQSHLAGFDAQGIDGVFKIVCLCEDKVGHDKTEVRIDRLVNRKDISMEAGKKEVREREEGNLKKWRRLYVNGDTTWVYWDKKYYDLVVNTYMMNQKESVAYTLQALGLGDKS